MSDRKSRQMIRRVKQLNPNSILVVTGCYAQVAAKELEKIEEIDLIVGNTEKKDILNIVEKHVGAAICRPETKRKDISNKINLTDINNQKEFVDFGTTTYTEKTRAVIKVQDGCNNFCSYCIIPYARGRVRSRNEENIIKEITQIAKNGIQEVVITGIHVASYGKDFGNENGLIELLEKINAIDGIVRIRLGSLEPKVITEEFMQRLVKLEKICHHFHLSLQSGCDETLKRMNRKYTTSEFEIVTKLLRNKFPNASLTTDIIVGFPGETEAEFEQTYEFLKKIAFYKMHVFKYSQRKGTKAAVMPNQIDGSIKEQRSKRLLELSDENEQKYNSGYVGKVVEVLFEEKDGEYYKGHTKNYIQVLAKGENWENEIVNVEIKEIFDGNLVGSF